VKNLNRRSVLKGAVASALASNLPVRAWAQAEPIKIGILTPLTGAGGNDGPRMLKAMQAVFEEVNKAGGVLGRKVETVVEDDQTNPEAAVRAARKLIEVDKVSCIMGTWASAVTSAVAPVCWESKTFLMTVSGADSITLLPHQGFLVRTQPNSKLQAISHVAQRLAEPELHPNGRFAFRIVFILVVGRNGLEVACLKQRSVVREEVVLAPVDL